MDVRANDLCFSYNRRDTVLGNVSHYFKQGTVTAILGPNGSGKSTLLRCLNGSLKPQSGDVLIGGESVYSLSVRQIASKIAVVPQDTPADIPFTVRQIVLQARYPYGSFIDGYNEDDERIAMQSIERMGISHLTDRRFGSLSGGERQRAVLARALCQQCDIMLFDEPDTHLDISHQLELYHLIRALADQGKTIILVCHDIFISPMFTDNAILLKNGYIAASGRRDDVLTYQNLADVFGVSIKITRHGDGSFCCSL